MIFKKLFLASSSELRDDRKAFEIFIGRKNKDWVNRGVFIELVVWEDFLDALSQTRLQEEYNRAIRECDLFVMLLWTKVGQYTAEEFEAAFQQFKSTNKPFIFTYFKEAAAPGAVASADVASLAAFKAKLGALGHYFTRYPNTEGLQLHFSGQLDKLVASGFIEFNPDRGEADRIAGGDLNTGTQVFGDQVGGDKVAGDKIHQEIDTGGGAYFAGNVQVTGNLTGRDHITHGSSNADVVALLDRLDAEVLRSVAADRQKDAERKLSELRSELEKGLGANDSRLAKTVDGLAERVPEAVGPLVSLFATPILTGVAGPVTKFVLDKLKGG